MSFKICLFINHFLLHVAKASFRSKQLQRYKGNWATLEIMKTLLKNRRSYKNRIGSLDDQHDEDNPKKEIDGEELEVGGEGEEGGKNDGNNSDDDWEGMYANGTDNGSGGEDARGGKDVNGNEDGSGDEVEDENGRKDVYGGDIDDEDEELEFGRNDDEGMNGGGSRSAKQAGKKRKVTEDDEPATTVKTKKSRLDSSEDYQVATRSSKKAVSKRKYSKK